MIVVSYAFQLASSKWKTVRTMEPVISSIAVSSALAACPVAL